MTSKIYNNTKLMIIMIMIIITVITISKVITSDLSPGISPPALKD